MCSTRVPLYLQVYSSMERYYNIIYDQCFSPNGKHLITCDRFGHIAVFKYVTVCSVYLV